MLQYTGITTFSEPRWWNVGYAKLQGEDLNYLGVPGLRIAGSQGVLIIAVCQVSLEAWLLLLGLCPRRLLTGLHVHGSEWAQH